VMPRPKHAATLRYLIEVSRPLPAAALNGVAAGGGGAAAGLWRTPAAAARGARGAIAQMARGPGARPRARRRGGEIP
jgi:hypothetical protein